VAFSHLVPRILAIEVLQALAFSDVVPIDLAMEFQCKRALELVAASGVALPLPMTHAAPAFTRNAHRL
jgi:hypothetical protein